MTELDPLILNDVEYTGKELRRLHPPFNEGRIAQDDLLVTTSGSSLRVSVAAGECYVQGDDVTRQGIYRCVNDAAKDSQDFELGGIGAASGSNPRIDRIVARVKDDEADGSGLNKWRLEVLAGTPTAGATLSNLNGAVDPIPNSCLLLANVLIPTSFTGPFVNATHIANVAPLAIIKGAKVQTAALVAATSDLTLTASYQDVPGATVTFTPDVDSIALVHAVFDFALSAASGVAQSNVGTLVVDGVSQDPLQALLQSQTVDTDAVRATVSQIFSVPLTGGVSHTLKLQAKHFNGGIANLVESTNTGFIYQLVAQ